MIAIRFQKQLAGPLEEHVQRTQGAYLAICSRLDRYVSRQELRKRVFGYELNPRRPCRPRARTHGEVWEVERITGETKVQADILQNKLIMVRRARDEVKRAAGAVLRNLDMLNEAVGQCKLGIKEANEASRLFDNHRAQERILFHSRSPRSRDARKQGHGPEVSSMPSKKAKKSKKPKAAGGKKGGESATLSGGEMRDLVTSLYDGSIPKSEDGAAQKRGIRVRLRAADHDWRTTFADLIAKTREGNKEAAPKRTSKKVSKKKKT